MSFNMEWEVKGTVALITGGASGIGFSSAKELLRQGARGVAIADINAEQGKNAIEDLESEFGKDKAEFIITNVADISQFREAFNRTIKKFQNVDILINNAGTINDAEWIKMIAVNMVGTIHGIMLGLHEFLPKYKQGPTGVILNVSSIAGVKELECLPIYCGTKFAIHGMSKSWGTERHFQERRIRVVCFCPGATATPIMADLEGKLLSEFYEDLICENAADVSSIPTQSPDECAKSLCEVVKHAKTGTVWIGEGKMPPYEFVLPEREIFIPKIENSKL